ncbi:MAG: hypothetical protein KTR21_03545 [Rhodobacteraceae bacterium]|nr:hypothetical protein [Paracoccaceae bacterium]
MRLKRTDGRITALNSRVSGAALAAYLLIAPSAALAQSSSEAANLTPPSESDVEAALQLGDKRLEQGNQLAALMAYRQGATLARRRSEASADKPEVLYDESLGVEKIAGLFETRRDYLRATMEYQKVLKIRRNLAEGDVDALKYDYALGRILYKLGRLRERRDSQRGALAAYDEAATVLRGLPPEDQERVNVLSLLNASLVGGGRVRLVNKDNVNALRRYQSSVTIAEKLVEIKPDELRWRFERAAAHQRVGYLASAIDAFDIARTGLETATAEYIALIDAEFRVEQSRNELMFVSIELGLMETRLKRFHEARPHLLRAMTLLKRDSEAAQLDKWRKEWLPHIEGALTDITAALR